MCFMRRRGKRINHTLTKKKMAARTFLAPSVPTPPQRPVLRGATWKKGKKVFTLINTSARLRGREPQGMRKYGEEKEEEEKESE